MNNFELVKMISSFVIGDGYMRLRGRNANYAFKQIAKHGDYVRWQADILSSVTGVRVFEVGGFTDKNGVNHQPVVGLETHSHPIFTTIFNRNYFGGRKTVSLHDVKNFDWQSLAIWYMDDGYILRSADKSKRGGVYLCTDNFNEAEVTMLQKLLYANFNLPFSLQRRGFTFRLHLTPKNTQVFLDGVAPFMFDSFKYKLHTENTVKAVDGIV